MTTPIAARLRELTDRIMREPVGDIGPIAKLSVEAAAEIDALRLALAGAEERAAYWREECQKTIANYHAQVARVTTLEADLSRAVEQCLEQQKLLDEYKAVHVAVCAERDDLQARCAELESVLKKLEREATLVSNHGATTGPQWTRLAGAILKARSAIAPAPGEGEKT